MIDRHDAENLVSILDAICNLTPETFAAYVTKWNSEPEKYWAELGIVNLMRLQVAAA